MDKLKTLKRDIDKINEMLLADLDIRINDTNISIVVKAKDIISNVVFVKFVSLQNLRGDFNFYYSPTSEGLIFYIE